MRGWFDNAFAAASPTNSCTNSLSRRYDIKMLELTNVTKLYGSVIGVNDISLTLEPGAYGLLGPNGSGKSTLLNLLTGQLRPSRGSVSVLGGDPWNNRRVLSRIGLCPERDVLYHDVTGLEWVSYLLELHGKRKAVADDLARTWLTKVGMQDAMNRAIGGYSLGMRQRTKLAQSLAHEPELLFLDEPFNGLDPMGRHETTKLLHDWTAEGRSIILASHVLHEVEAVTRSFLLIRNGRLQAAGSADEIHRLLKDVPTEIRMKTPEPRRLASCLMRLPGVQTMSVNESAGELRVGMNQSGELISQLPELLHHEQLTIEEMASSEESLEELFATLNRVHRGEA